jgi:hypothetical protein
MIDMEQARKPVQEFIESSLRSFAVERSDVMWSTFGLLAYPMGGWISTNFDTEANSAEYVAVAHPHSSCPCGEDEWGRFNDSCADFEFFDWSCLQLPTWENEYHGADLDEGRPLHVRDLSGRDHFISTENKFICSLAFQFVRVVFLDLLNSMKGSPLLPKTRHRFGVQIPHSGFSEFWRAEDVVG